MVWVCAISWKTAGRARGDLRTNGTVAGPFSPIRRVVYDGCVLAALAPLASRPAARRAAVVVAAAFGLLVLAALFVSGTTGVAIAAGIGLLPIAAFLAARAPLVFPFGLYVAVIPFDSILFVSGSCCRFLSRLWLVSSSSLLFATY